MNKPAARSLPAHSETYPYCFDCFQVRQKFIIPPTARIRVIADRPETPLSTWGKIMRTLRRVVTGNNAEGKSYIVSDEQVSQGVLWQSDDQLPLGSGADIEDALAGRLPSTVQHMEPGTGGNLLFFGSFPPWSSARSRFADGGKTGFDEQGFHRTETIDYLLIMTGEIELLLDESRVLLKAGDLVIQRNTRHAWHNLTDQTVHYLAVSIKLPMAADNVP
jgi:Cupin domain